MAKSGPPKLGEMIVWVTLGLGLTEFQPKSQGIERSTFLKVETFENV